jgi:hypothetical protein
MKIFKGLIIGLIVCTIAACTGNNTTDKQPDSVAVNVEVKQGDPLAPANWQCYDIETEKICIPKTWGIVQQNQFFLLSDLSKISPGAYFVVLKNNKKLNNYDVNGYLKKVYTELKTDTARKLLDYTVVRINYEDKQMVSGQYFTSIKNERYITFSTIFEKGNDLYEVALKIREAKAKEVQDNYKAIVFNFYSKGKPMFTAADKIKRVTKVDLAKL